MSEVRKRPVVLIVDDDDIVRRGLGKVLERAGFEVELMANGADALACLARRPIDVVLSDIGMPQMGGLEILRAVRERDLDLPVVLITGAPDLQSAIDAMEYGAFRYLVKPATPEHLIETISRAARIHEMALLRREARGLDGEQGLQLGDRASLDTHFDKALQALWIAFQPILRAGSPQVFAYEALVRSAEPTLPGPRDLFDAAERLGRARELGRAIRRLVAESAPSAPPDALLFVNVHPDELADDELLLATSPLGAIGRRVVLEITERSALDRVPTLGARIAQLRALGFRIAIDDLGAGYAGLTSFARLEPEIVKIDMTLVRGIDQSEQKQKIVRGITRLCVADLGLTVVCEGVETEAELATLRAQGLELFQGFYFARPSPGFVAPSRWAL